MIGWLRLLFSDAWRDTVTAFIIIAVLYGAWSFGAFGDGFVRAGDLGEVVDERLTKYERQLISLGNDLEALKSEVGEARGDLGKLNDEVGRIGRSVDRHAATSTATMIRTLMFQRCEARGAVRDNLEALLEEYQVQYAIMTGFRVVDRGC